MNEKGAGLAFEVNMNSSKIVIEKVCFDCWETTITV